MYLNFAWRYFKGKKTTNAINIIAWVTTGVIAFATCCQILVLCVFNGFEGLVQSLYSSFYADMKIVPEKGKTFRLTPLVFDQIKKIDGVQSASCIIEEKALLQNSNAQSVIQLKGVDSNFIKVSGVPDKITEGSFDLGNDVEPGVILGSGIQYATGISLEPGLIEEKNTVILPKMNVPGTDPVASISEGIINPSGVFSIQQEFDNSYAITNIDFVRQHIGLEEDQFTSVELKLQPNADENKIKQKLQNILGRGFVVQNKYEQNTSLYQTMKIEKWVIYAVLTLILVIAAFNMISALTMLVLEKKQDISILQSMGTSRMQIKKIFLSEGLLLGIIGTVTGIAFATVICLLQIKFQFIKLNGGSFLIHYFPVKLVLTDFLLVGATALIITFIASWFPAQKASKQPISLR
ncbi:MAG: ABC transporter permease [Ferruginibacter sp.]|nr:ABC transporter permease [Ferruginibacter sp.]